MYSMTRFSQLLKYFPTNSFNKIVDAEKADRYVKSFKSLDLLKLMLYGQISQSKSLRRLVDGFNSHSNGHYHLNTKIVRRSTVSDSLSKRSIEPFKHTCEILMKSICRSDRKQCKEFISIIDSSPIVLKGRGYSWAEQNRSNIVSGLKLHVELHSGHDAPSYVNLTAPNVCDITDAKENIQLQQCVTHVVDKGYVDYNWWHKINKKGAYFVCRTKSNTAMKSIKKLPVCESDKSTIKADEIIHLTNKRPGGNRINKYARKNLRLVSVFREGKKAMKVITNDFNRTAIEIANLYKQRWQVELFFKWIKQKLKLKTYFGQSENSVKIQIYCALICYLLMRLMHKNTDLWQKMIDLQTWLHHGLFIKDSINTHYYKRRKSREKLIDKSQMRFKFQLQNLTGQ